MRQFLIFLISFTAVFFNQLSTANQITHCPGQVETITLTTPKGWTRDFKNAQSLGLCVVYYPKNFNWQNSPVLLYPNIVPIEKTFKDSINKDIQKFKKKKPDIKILSKDLKLNNKQSVYKEFLNGPKANKFEGVVFSPLKKDVSMLTLSVSSSEKHFRHYQPTIKEFANSAQTRSNDVFFNDLQKAADLFKNKHLKLYNSIIKNSLPSFYQAIKACDLGSQKTSVILFFDKTQTLRNVFFKSRFNRCLRNTMIGNKTVKSTLAEFYIPIELDITQKKHKKN